MSSNTVVVPRNDTRYPTRLNRITDPPPKLFVRGELGTCDHALAVVGTRQMTPYGRFVTDAIVTPLARMGIVIISGLAFGIDAAAHTACIRAGGRTLAVLAGGVDDDTIAPKTNAPLAHEILKTGGAVLSEFADGTQPYPAMFPQRNRIVAGLADAVLVIEAPEKSGALITARLALEYNRDVLVVPGPITSPMSAGTNAFLRLGATAITSPEDVLESLNLALAQTIPMTLKTNDPLQIKLLTYLDAPITIDALVQLSSLDTATIAGSLAIMELRGLIKQIGGNRYIKTQ